MFCLQCFDTVVGWQEGHPACKKLEWWGAGMVICLERDVGLHMTQLMPLPLTASCFSKIQIGFTFLVPAHLGSPGKRAVKRVCVCVSASDVRYFLAVWHIARAARRILCSIVLILVVGDDSLLTLMVYNATTVPPRLNITIHTHTLFNGLLSGTTRVGRYQKGKTNLDFTEARDSEWQWHQLGHMQICTSLQTDNHASTAQLSFFTPSCRPSNSVKALKAVALKALSL